MNDQEFEKLIKYSKLRKATEHEVLHAKKRLEESKNNHPNKRNRNIISKISLSSFKQRKIQDIRNKLEQIDKFKRGQKYGSNDWEQWFADMHTQERSENFGGNCFFVTLTPKVNEGFEWYTPYSCINSAEFFFKWAKITSSSIVVAEQFKRGTYHSHIVVSTRWSWQNIFSFCKKYYGRCDIKQLRKSEYQKQKIKYCTKYIRKSNGVDNWRIYRVGELEGLNNY
jgi:hypothetical protein